MVTLNGPQVNKTTDSQLLLIALALICFALSPAARAVTPSSSLLRVRNVAVRPF
jgi:hypothetical protein